MFPRLSVLGDGRLSTWPGISSTNSAETSERSSEYSIQ